MCLDIAAYIIFPHIFSGWPVHSFCSVMLLDLHLTWHYQCCSTRVKYLDSSPVFGDLDLDSDLKAKDSDLDLDLRVDDLYLDLDLKANDLDLDSDLRSEDLTTTLGITNEFF
jgi:hypothetical protein